MMSEVISNRSLTSSPDRLISRRKKKKKDQNSRNEAFPTTVQWKSDANQQVYSSKLLQALRQLRLSDGGGPTSRKRGRAVRETADKILAVTAKGRTRWSRAILTTRLKIKFRKKNNNKRQRVMAVAGNNRWQKKSRVSILRLKTKNLPAIKRKTRLLGRLVPGCRKEPLPVVLEEVTDYISALQMQVRAMTALTELLSGASISSTSRPPPT